MRTIYLDHNSTTPILPEVAASIARCHAEGHANPASQHGPGRRARQIIEDARERIAQLLGANTAGEHADRLIFTSGGTEANNLAMFGLAGESSGHLAVSAIEHPSVLAPAELLESRGWQVSRLPVDQHGVVQIGELIEVLSAPGFTGGSVSTPQRNADRSQIRSEPTPPADVLTSSQGLAPRQSRGLKETALTAVVQQSRGLEPSESKLTLIALMLGNNETGVLQPVGKLAEICAPYGVFLHTDAVQAVGKIPIDFRRLGAATLAFTAHKFHGPRGIGGLLVRSDVELRPLMFGGFQQAGLRPGTEDVALIVGLLTALEISHNDLTDRAARLSTLRDAFETKLRALLPEVAIHGDRVERLPHTSNVAFVGLDRRALVMALDLEGIACSTGSACASGSSEPSPVLMAMGLTEAMVASSLRFSFGTTTTAADIEEASERIVRVCLRLRSNSKNISGFVT